MWTFLVANYQLSFWGAVIAAIIAVLVAAPIAYWVSATWIESKRRNLFKVDFVDQPPPGEREVDRWRPRPIPVGQSEHLFRVIPSEGLKLQKFNVRFIDTAELAAGPGEPLIDVRRTILISEIDLMPELALEGIDGKMFDDKRGGITVVVAPPLDIAANEPLFLLLRVLAAKDGWSGKISFRARDPEGVRRHARKDVVISGVATPQTFKLKAPGATPTTQWPTSS